MSPALEGCIEITRVSADYPPRLHRLGGTAPSSLTTCGAIELLRLPLVGLFSSVRVPGDAVLAGLDLARAMRDRGTPTVGGFQAPLERECLEFLLRGAQPVVVCLARAIEGMRVPRTWAAAIRDRRLLVLSPFSGAPRRPTAGTTEIRNRVVAALADQICVVHATTGGRVYRLMAEAIRRRQRVVCPALGFNHDLMVLGAEPLTKPGVI